jgi:formylglycine-generating enzyme required for sulfatase activity
MAKGSKNGGREGNFTPSNPDPNMLELHRLLYLLLPALEANGFVLTPDRYLRLLRLIQALPSKLPLAGYRHSLCAILASDPDQQGVFHKLFDQYLTAIPQEEASKPAPGSESSSAPASSESRPVQPPPTPAKEDQAKLQEGRDSPWASRRPLVVDLDECTEPPFSWNIVPDKEDVPIETGPQFGRTLMQLRRRETAEYLLPDLPASIRATIGEGGVPVFRYRRPTRPTEYLLLVERYALDDHRAALFDHFYHTLRQSDVLMERFFYQGDLRLCRNERHPAGLNLQQLRYRYPDARLVVMGAGYRLLSPKTGEPANWLRPLYGWRRRILLTPISRLQWGQRERALEGLFTLLPASLQSLHFLSDAPDEVLHGGYDALPEYVRRIAEVEPLTVEPPFLKELFFHFGPEQLCWIAACAVYPALHFELTLRLGRLLSESLGCNLLEASHLLALTRIPWFSDGRMPPEARTELLEWLEYSFRKQHDEVLDYLHDLMENNPPPENSVAWAEHRINLALMELARNPQPDLETLAQLRAVIKRLDRPQRRGDFVLPNHWEALLKKVGLDEGTGPINVGMIFAERFQLEALIRSDDYTQVWRARIIEPGENNVGLDEESQENTFEGGQAAIKIFLAGESNSDYCKEEFDLTSRLEHPNILSVHDWGISNGFPWQTMPLHRPIAQPGEWEEMELWRLLRDIASALAYLHDQKPPITHNHINGWNILQSQDGDYLLSDFGLSSPLVENNPKTARPPVWGDFVEPGFQGGRFTPSISSDVYGLAFTVYKLSSGDQEFEFSNAPFKPLPLPSKFSRKLNDLLAACLSPQPESRPSAGKIRQDAEEMLRNWKELNQKMALIPAGTFEMGDVMGDKEYDNEKPVHPVTLDAFYLGKYAVTFEEYDAFCEATKRDKPGDSGWGRGKRPVINVSWEDAVAYCNWLSMQHGFQPVYTISGSKVTTNWNANGYRLPTEAEWEYAAREGGKKVRFGNGKDIADPKEINFDASASYKKPYSVAGEYRRKTVPAGSLNSPNALGLHDMSGNVWEWCWDWYGGYPSTAQINPKGPDTGSFRVFRGGSWSLSPAYVRVAHRFNSTPDDRDYGLGFRLARAQ